MISMGKSITHKWVNLPAMVDRKMLNHLGSTVMQVMGLEVHRPGHHS